MTSLSIPIEEFTTPDPVTASHDATLSELKNLMELHSVRHIPITKNGLVIGTVSENSLHLVSGLNKYEKSLVLAGDIMSPNPINVDVTTTLGDVAFEMSLHKTDCVIVNEGDSFFGIFTITDALNALVEISRDEEETEYISQF